MRTFLKIAVLFLAFTLQSAAQGVDTVYMLNGETRAGKVTAINADAIKFVYKGETLEYEFKKTDINKIVYASGRTETYTQVQNSVEKQVSAADRKGKIAILPFNFTTNDTGLQAENMSHQIQQNCADAVSHEATQLKVQDPMQTNAILARNNLDAISVILQEPKELAAMLGVEFVVFGSTNIVNKGSSTYGSGSTTYQDKKDKSKSSGTEYSSNSSTTIINYETTVDIKIYNDQGTSIFNNTRTSFGTQIDSYKETVKYIIKRTPFGSKHK